MDRPIASSAVYPNKRSRRRRSTSGRLLEGFADDRIVGRFDDGGEQRLGCLSLPELRDVRGERPSMDGLCHPRNTRSR